MSVESLSFFVIGAQKAETTTLHHYLKSHPSLLLPAEKEAPFFSDEERFNRGLNCYLGEFFPKNKGGRLLGTVTPQYMSYPMVPERMYRTCPHAKLIAILRDPIERAKSHYKMRVRAIGERRSFWETIVEQLDKEQIEISRQNPTPSNSFVSRGEYGRILSQFLKYYPRNQLLGLFSEDPAKNPVAVLAKMCGFLGVDLIEWDITQKRYNATPDAYKLSLSVLIANMIQHQGVRRLVRHLLPVWIKQRLKFWSITHRYDPKVGRIDVTLSDEVRRRLALHFLEDLAELEMIVHRPIPWEERLKHDSRQQVYL